MSLPITSTIKPATAIPDTVCHWEKSCTQHCLLDFSAIQGVLSSIILVSSAGNSDEITLSFVGTMADDSKVHPSRPITPLWIIGSFISLTETVIIFAIIKTTGHIQELLTYFAMGFPAIVAISFLCILWNKPWVLYPPSEFGPDQDVTKFVTAMTPRLRVRAKKYSKELKSSEETT